MPSSLLMKYSQIEHTLVSVLFWNLVAQPQIVTREAENVLIWPGETSQLIEI